jgi:hypothetical protein
MTEAYERGEGFPQIFTNAQGDVIVYLADGRSVGFSAPKVSNAPCPECDSDALRGVAEGTIPTADELGC